MTTTEQVLQSSIIDGNVVKLPPTQLDRKLYTDVKKRIEGIGGHWVGGKIQGFVFASDPTELLQAAAGGEKRNLKKEFQFFATPDNLADRLVQLADIGPNDIVVEPEAGQGAIVKAIHRATYAGRLVYGYEPMPTNKPVLETIIGFIHLGDDFLKDESPVLYDRIIANPPFSNNQDIDHIRRMYEVLKPAGRIVTLASRHWQNSGNKKEQQFKRWLKGLDAEVIDVPAGEFKESGTDISTVIIVIDKKK